MSMQDETLFDIGIRLAQSRGTGRKLSVVEVTGHLARFDDGSAAHLCYGQMSPDQEAAYIRHRAKVCKVPLREDQ